MFLVVYIVKIAYICIFITFSTSICLCVTLTDPWNVCMHVCMYICTNVCLYVEFQVTNKMLWKK